MPDDRKPPGAPAPLPQEASIPIQWEIGSDGVAPDGTPRFTDPRRNRIVRPLAQPGIVSAADAKGIAELRPQEGRTCEGCRWFDRDRGQRAIAGRLVPQASLAKMTRYGALDPTVFGCCGVLRQGVVLTSKDDPACHQWEPAGRLVGFHGQRFHGGSR